MVRAMDPNYEHHLPNWFEQTSVKTYTFLVLSNRRLHKHAPCKHPNTFQTNDDVRINPSSSSQCALASSSEWLGGSNFKYNTDIVVGTMSAIGIGQIMAIWRLLIFEALF